MFISMLLFDLSLTYICAYKKTKNFSHYFGQVEMVYIVLMYFVIIIKSFYSLENI